MAKLKASNSSITKKFSNSLNDTNKGSEKEPHMENLEKCILQNPADKIDGSRDQFEDLPEEDPEEESGEEVEEDPEEESGEELEVDAEEVSVEELEEDPEEKTGEELQEDPEEESDEELQDDPEEVSGEELEEDPEEKAGKKLEEAAEEKSDEELEEDPEEKTGQELKEDPEEESDEELEEDLEEGEELEEDSEEKPGEELEEDPEEESGEELEEDAAEESGEELEEDPEEKTGQELKEDPEEESYEELKEDPEEESYEELEEDLEEESGEELEEDAEEKPGEELEEDPEEESGEELEEDAEEESGEEVEEDPEEESGEELEDDPEEKPEIDNKWGKTSGNEIPLFSQASLYQPQKKCEQEGMRIQKLESELSRPKFSNDTVISAATTDKFGSKEEGAGSSGKQRRSRWEPQPDGDGIKDDGQTCKRRKTRWSSEDTQTKMPGPLQLPDFTQDIFIGSDKDPKVQGLKAELLEINRKLQSPLIDDRLEGERSTSPEPIYDNLGIRLNTREVRLRRKLTQKRQNIISKLIILSPTFNPPPDDKPAKFSRKLYIPVKEYPDYNFIGLIIGPRGNTQKNMEKETGAHILLRGKGSLKTPGKHDSEKEDLHVYIEANNQKSLDAAVGMVEKLLIPIEEGKNEHKRAQLRELAVLKSIHRDENVCSVCRDPGHKHYACPNLQSTFKMDSFDTGRSNSLSTPTCPVTALFPHSDSVQGSGLILSSMQNSQTRPGKEISDKNIYVGYLPQSIDDNRLTELFSPFGKITEAKVVKDRTTGISKGFGFVKFNDSKEAALAIAHLNGFKIDGKCLKVRIAGLQPYNEPPRLNPIPQYRGPAAVSANVTSQTTLSGPLHFMLPEHQSSFHVNGSTNMFSCTVNSEHVDPMKEKAIVFTPPLNTLISPDFSYSGDMHFAGSFSDRSSFSSNNSTSRFPGDPDNLGNFSRFL